MRQTICSLHLLVLCSILWTCPKQGLHVTILWFRGSYYSTIMTMYFYMSTLLVQSITSRKKEGDSSSSITWPCFRLAYICNILNMLNWSIEPVLMTTTSNTLSASISDLTYFQGSLHIEALLYHLIPDCCNPTIRDGPSVWKPPS